jgi:hypothetical protein
MKVRCVMFWAVFTYKLPFDGERPQYAESPKK